MSSLLVFALLAGLVVVGHAGEPSAGDLYKRGRKFEKKKDYANAYILYSQAAALDKAKPEYWQRAQALQRRATTAAGVLPAGSSPSAAAAEPTLEPILPEAEDLAEVRRLQPPVELSAADQPQAFDLRADARALWESVMKTYAIEVVFDGDYDAGAPRTFRVSGAGFREALHALSTVTSSFVVPISPNLLMVVKDTEQKRREVENTMVVAIPIPEPVTLQEAQELARTVQQVMEIQRFGIDSAQRLAIFRDRVSKVRPAELLFRQLLHARAQISVEVELISAAKTSTISYGLGVPTSFPIEPLIKTITLGGGPVSFGLGIGAAQLLANANKSEARTLYQAQIRSSDGQQAQLHVGEKYPIMTLGYFGNVPEGETAYTPPPSFNFEDLGLVVKLTPKVHDVHELTLEIEAEFKLLGPGNLNGIPVISNRRFGARARLRFGEAAIISGLVSRNDVRLLSGPAGVLSFPLLGPLLGRTNITQDDSQILLVIKPRLLSVPPTELITRELWLGSETRPRMPL